MATIAGPIITRPPFVEPDCHDHFQPIFPHNDLCRASLGANMAGTIFDAPANASMMTNIELAIVRSVAAFFVSSPS